LVGVIIANVKATESDIIRSICDYLALRKHHFWRQNTAPTVQKSTNRWQYRRMHTHALKGVPDIIVIKPPSGQFVALEVKRPEGRLSVEQKEFEAACQARGGQYHVVHSIEEVQALGL
jgi:hypothetical protein